MDTRSLLQSFAMDKDSWIRSVEEVARGLACECLCPCCGDAVLARQGEIREWHFAHASGSQCEGAVESALHLAAKELLLEHKGTSTPEACARHEVRLPDGRVGKGEAVRPEQWTHFDSVEAEKRVGTIRPDVVAVIEQHMLFIEVAVTHFVDEEKCAELQRLGVPTIEIDLASLKDEHWTWERLTEVVIESALHKRWLLPPNDVALMHQATGAALRNAEAQPLPTPSQQSSTAPARAPRTRFWINGRMVDAIERPFGIAVWCPYDPDLNALLKPIIRNLGGRWQPRFKNWLLPLEGKSWLFEELNKLSAESHAYPGSYRR
jgi:hypothetical protein